MKRIAVAACVCGQLGCSGQEPEWSDEPGIEVCEQIVLQCESFESAYSDEFEACAVDVVETTELEERTDTIDCDLYIDAPSLIVVISQSVAAADNFELCTARMHDRACWRYP